MSEGYRVTPLPSHTPSGLPSGMSGDTQDQRGRGITVGNIVRCIQDDLTLSFSDNYGLVKIVNLRFKNCPNSKGMNLSDFSSLTPFAVSTLELGLPSGRDLVMDGPFQEPDEYFLKRQRKAFDAVV